MAISAGAIKAGKAFVELFVDDSRMRRGLRTAGASLEAFGSRVNRISGQILRFGSVVAVGMVPIVKAAADAQEELSKFDAVFRGQAKSAGKFSDELATSLGRSRYEIRSTMATLQSFFVGLGYGGREAAKFAEEMTRLSIDFASFNNLADSEASQRFISALSGSSEVVDKFGINLKQAAIEQEIFNQGLDKSYAQLTEQEKVMLRLNIIRRAMAQQGAIGDALRTRDSMANQFRALAAQIKELAVEIGNALMPLIKSMVQYITPLITKLGQWINKNKELVKTLAKIALYVGGGALAVKSFALVAPPALGVGSFTGTAVNHLRGAASAAKQYRGTQLSGRDALGAMAVAINSERYDGMTVAEQSRVPGGAVWQPKPRSLLEKIKEKMYPKGITTGALIKKVGLGILSIISISAIVTAAVAAVWTHIKKLEAERIIADVSARNKRINDRAFAGASTREEREGFLNPIGRPENRSIAQRINDGENYKSRFGFDTLSVENYDAAIKEANDVIMALRSKLDQGESAQAVNRIKTLRSDIQELKAFRRDNLSEFSRRGLGPRLDQLKKELAAAERKAAPLIEAVAATKSALVNWSIRRDKIIEARDEQDINKSLSRAIAEKIAGTRFLMSKDPIIKLDTDIMEMLGLGDKKFLNFADTAQAQVYEQAVQSFMNNLLSATFPGQGKAAAQNLAKLGAPAIKQIYKALEERQLEMAELERERMMLMTPIGPGITGASRVQEEQRRAQRLKEIAEELRLIDVESEKLQKVVQQMKTAMPEMSSLLAQFIGPLTGPKDAAKDRRNKAVDLGIAYLYDAAKTALGGVKDSAQETLDRIMEPFKNAIPAAVNIPSRGLFEAGSFASLQASSTSDKWLEKIERNTREMKDNVAVFD